MKDTTNRRARTGECVPLSSCSRNAGQSQGDSPERFGDLLARFVAGIDPDAADAYVHLRVKFRVDRLGEKFRLSAEEREDLTQDLLTALVQAIPRYDRRRSTWKTFVSRVLNRRYCYLLRQLLRVENDEIPQTVAFDDLGECFGESVVDPARAGGDPSATADLRMDMEAALAKMSPRQQEIARLLMHHSIRKAAKLLGTSPSAIRWAMHHIRACFREAGLRIFLDRPDTVSPLA